MKQPKNKSQAPERGNLTSEKWRHQGTWQINFLFILQQTIQGVVSPQLQLENSSQVPPCWVICCVSSPLMLRQRQHDNIPSHCVLSSFSYLFFPPNHQSLHNPKGLLASKFWLQTLLSREPSLRQAMCFLTLFPSLYTCNTFFLSL